jgi:glycosyltransferase involved in cell wall biosynthesis
LTRQEGFPVKVDPAWRERYRQLGISLIEIHDELLPSVRWSDVWPVRLSERVEKLLEGFDIAYFQDWANVAFQSARARRFRASGGPVLVTVLHGPSAWVRNLNRQYPNLPDDLHVEFIERYSAEHSDYVISPSQYMLDWAREHGWQFSGEPRVLGLPYIPDSEPAQSHENARDSSLVRLVFFGRLEVRKGFDLFTSALHELSKSPHPIRELVLLGRQATSGAVDEIRGRLSADGINVTHLADLDSRSAFQYLTGCANKTLVVIPSPVENFPYALIEASSITGLNVIFSNGGGFPEVLGPRAQEQMFDPHPAALASKIRERLAAPLPADRLVSYDYAAANQRWLDFHQEAKAPRLPKRRAAHPASVDVCITYFNKNPYFADLLAALDGQTRKDFGVIAVDDGSPDPAARDFFDSMSQRYDRPGWTFFRQENGFVDTARNRAADRSKADYLLFVDADDIVQPNAIECLLEAAERSGDDCLLSGGYLFEGNFPPSEIQARYIPLGPNLISGLVDPMVFGLPMILIRRSVFLAVGGYTECRGVAHEDWELQVKLLLAGHRVDVVPECLLFFRRLPDGLANTSPDYPAKQRLIGSYEKRLAEVGLGGMASLILALNDRYKQLEARINRDAGSPKAVLSSRVRMMLAKLQDRAPSVDQ